MSDKTVNQPLWSAQDRRFAEQVFRKLGRIYSARLINDEAELISLSGELRSLLVDGAFLKAWYLVGQRKPVVVRAYQIDTTDPNAISLAGHDMLVDKIPISLNWGKDRRHLRNFKLNDYVKATAIYYLGHQVSRAQLIEFIANTEGGIHIDFTLSHAKGKDKEIFSALSEFAERGFCGIKSNANGVSQIYGQLRAICDEIHTSREVMEFMGLVGPLFAASYPNSPLASQPYGKARHIR